jgi:hypothetical protein
MFNSELKDRIDTLRGEIKALKDCEIKDLRGEIDNHITRWHNPMRYDFLRLEDKLNKLIDYLNLELVQEPATSKFRVKKGEKND